ncbi:kinase-like domain-containing protein [Geopyxis carbonaria]|nr:kinase-like domain-containing protein [Geopyxis carbonaria]
MSALPASLLPASISKHRHTSTYLASLWSSYGSIHALTVHSTPPQSFVVKHIDAPPGTSVSHKRKLTSYAVERWFYTHLAARLSASVKVADCTHADPAAGVLVLEDLRPSFPVPAGGSVSAAQAAVVLQWLAGFHAAFWGAADTIAVDHGADTDTGVWEQGSYWYLDTRRDEWEDMDEPWLESAAIKADAVLKDPHQPGRTLVHGDLKAANIVFSRDGATCAVYDFQYVGHGLGVRDVVYFLATSVARGVMGDAARVQALMKVYYSALEAAVEGGLGDYTEEVMMEQLDWALVDWYRFMAGWGVWGNGWASERRVREIVARLDAEP